MVGNLALRGFAERSLEERNTLVENHLRLPYFVYYRLRRQSDLRRLNEDEAVSAGNFALIKAAQKWNPTKGTFRTYASRCIERAMRREAGDATSLTRATAAAVSGGCSADTGAVTSRPGPSPL